jgi:hypothetical protein
MRKPPLSLRCFRDGFLGAVRKEKRQTLLTLSRLTAFESLPDGLGPVLAQARRAYPPANPRKDRDSVPERPIQPGRGVTRRDLEEFQSLLSWINFFSDRLPGLRRGESLPLTHSSAPARQRPHKEGIALRPPVFAGGRRHPCIVACPGCGIQDGRLPFPPTERRVLCVGVLSAYSLALPWPPKQAARAPAPASPYRRRRLPLWRRSLRRLPPQRPARHSRLPLPTLRAPRPRRPRSRRRSRPRRIVSINPMRRRWPGAASAAWPRRRSTGSNLICSWPTARSAGRSSSFLPGRIAAEREFEPQ